MTHFVGHSRNFLRRTLILTFFCGLLITCDNNPKNFKLAFAPNGHVQAQGQHSHLVTKIGPMAPSVTQHLKEPERGVTRLIVRNTKLPNNYSDNIFDINFSTSIDIKGNGQYRVNKSSNSKIWILEIDGDKVQELSIIEGEPTQSENYSGMGGVLMVFGGILLFIGLFSIPAGGIGCLIIFIGFILLMIGSNLSSSVS